MTSIVMDSTATLLARARAGDPLAKNQLCQRFRPLLMRWAHGRLPPYARDGITQTDDLVQNTLVRALNSMSTFEPRHEGAFLAYLRKVLLNQIRDRIRRARRRPEATELDESAADSGRSPLERTIGAELLERYDRALEQLPEEHRQAVILRIELGYSYQQVAESLGKPSPNAARLTVTRALVRLARMMDDLR
jgi:RNA polymerase sigma-70 factor (ECF subfamily)